MAPGSKWEKVRPWPPIVNGNQIMTTIKVDRPKSYSLEWCKSQDAPAINAWCEIFRPAGKSGHVKIVRIANHYMAEDDPRTQSRSSKGRLELPLQRDTWLWTPPTPKRFVSLEVRRLRKPPKEKKRLEQDNPGSLLYETDVDMFDGDGVPYITFRFEFEVRENTDKKTDLSVSSSRMSRRGIRRAPLRYRSKQDPRGKSSDLSELSSSESDPDGPPLASVVARKKKHSQVEVRGATSSNNVSAEQVAPEGNIDLLLKKRKTIIQQQEEMEEEKRLKRAKREKLVQDLEKDYKKRTVQLAKEKDESREIDDDIEKMEAALYMG
ncbi:hypothetical protein B0H13DRAFT_1889611 [Mycena leptocephala]|nr:hypothetical protein B0H13DRAFT_1889611 [Mycena leptocephala]